MKIGFIGAGNMGGAIIRSLIRNGRAPDSIFISKKHPEDSAEWKKMGIRVLQSNRELAQNAEMVVLAVKPYQAQAALEETGGALAGKLVVSIMAGWSYAMLENALPADTRFIRAMPNTPLLLGEGMTVISSRARCSREDFACVKALFEGAGRVAVTEDSVFAAANAISGCGPAFVYAFIEALADGGVRCGVPRALAYELAAQTMIGAGRMALKTGQHPGALKDAVCSPGGVTIEGVFALEQGGMRAAVMDAVGRAAEKSLKMEK